jgi:hypothetical protein
LLLLFCGFLATYLTIRIDVVGRFVVHAIVGKLLWLFLRTRKNENKTCQEKNDHRAICKHGRNKQRRIVKDS